ncbi:MAG: hypothetical protein JST84_11300 [Acidobacteria bacterium]|nr:hypothetical protein [Acidobacteriota bacterium]
MRKHTPDVAEMMHKAEQALDWLQRTGRGCVAITKAGTPCKGWAMANSPLQLCSSHFNALNTRSPSTPRLPLCYCADGATVPHRPFEGTCNRAEEQEVTKRVRRHLQRLKERLASEDAIPQQAFATSSEDPQVE